MSSSSSTRSEDLLLLFPGDRVIVHTFQPREAAFVGTVVTAAAHRDFPASISSSSTSQANHYIYVHALQFNSTMTKKFLPPSLHSKSVVGFDGWVPRAWCEKVASSSSANVSCKATRKGKQYDSDSDDDNDDADGIVAKRDNSYSVCRDDDDDICDDDDDNKKRSNKSTGPTVTPWFMPFDLKLQPQQQPSIEDQQEQQQPYGSTVRGASPVRRATSYSVDRENEDDEFDPFRDVIAGGSNNNNAHDPQENAHQRRSADDDDDNEAADNDDDDDTNSRNDVNKNNNQKKSSGMLGAAVRDAEFPVSIFYLGFEMCKLIKTAWAAVLDFAPPKFTMSSSASNNSNGSGSNISAGGGALLHSIHLCHRCLTPLPRRSLLTNHFHVCTATNVPRSADHIYTSSTGDVSVYRIDGALEPEFAQRLAILGRCFIEAKDLWDTPLPDTEFFALYCSAPRLGMTSENSLITAAAASGDASTTTSTTSQNSSFDPCWMPDRCRLVSASAAQNARTLAVKQFDDSKRDSGKTVRHDLASLQQRVRVAEHAARAATRRDPQPVYFAGYFSRIRSAPSQTLSCIMLLPPFQGRGLGSLIMKLAFALDSVRLRECGCEQYCGGGEHPGRVAQPWSHAGKQLVFAHFNERMRLGVKRIMDAECAVSKSVSQGAKLTAEDVFGRGRGTGVGGSMVKSGSNSSSKKSSSGTSSREPNPFLPFLDDDDKSGSAAHSQAAATMRARAMGIELKMQQQQPSSSSRQHQQHHQPINFENVFMTMMDNPDEKKQRRQRDAGSDDDDDGDNDGKKPAGKKQTSTTTTMMSSSSSSSTSPLSPTYNYSASSFANSSIRQYCITTCQRSGPQPWVKISNMLAPTMNHLDCFDILKEQRLLAQFSVRNAISGATTSSSSSSTATSDSTIGVVLIPRETVASATAPNIINNFTSSSSSSASSSGKQNGVTAYIKKESREIEDPSREFTEYDAYMFHA